MSLVRLSHTNDTLADSRFLAQFHHTKQFCAVVGRDSDFLVYRGCQCIMDFGELLEGEANVFSQQKLAAWLGFAPTDYEG